MCLILEAKFGDDSLETNYFSAFLCIRAFFRLSQADLLPYLNTLFFNFLLNVQLPFQNHPNRQIEELS